MPSAETHDRAARIHEMSAVLHETAATLQVRHAAEMGDVGNRSWQERAEKLAVQEWLLADREVESARLEQQLSARLAAGNP